jgi:hypothetical protein
MLSENFSLQFEGFKPNEEITRKIRIAMSDLYSKSPHQSFLKATFKSTGQVFEGVIDITSAAGKFVVEVADKDFELATGSAFEKIKFQLEAWKQTRFA